MPNSIEKAASKTMGAVKVIKADLKGLGGVFKKLMQEHGEVSALMKRVTMTSDEKVRRELYPTIRKELLSHEKAELAVVYPVLRQYAETRSIAEQHDREASELESTIEHLDAINMGSPEWAPAFEGLVKMVLKHVDEEESDFFPTAQKTIGETQASAMEERYELAKKSALHRVS